MRPLLRRSTLFVGSALFSMFALARPLPGAAAVGSAESGASEATADVSTPEAQVMIPGPRRSFLRMAGISQKASVEETLPLLANEVRMRGYVRGRATEYLLLLKRYLQQARKLSQLAGSKGVIEVASCKDAQPLLDILGYRVHEPCGPETSVQTSDPELAFLTIDSGFPLSLLEEALREDQPFTLPYASSAAPVLFTAKEWSPNSANLLDTLIDDPALARLYSAFARMDTETALYLRHSIGISRLVRYAGAMDFYGAHIAIRSGHVEVPGGTFAEPAWKSLVGAGPDAPADFIARLLSKDQGWLAAYFDAVSYAAPKQQEYFVSLGRLKRFYEAFRGPAPIGNPTRPIFRPAPGLPLLMARLDLEPDGQPHIPGNVGVWKEILRSAGHGNSRWARRAERVTTPDDLVEVLFSQAREFSTEGTLECFLTLSEIDRGRSAGELLTPETVRLLAERFARYGDQYSTFAEFHDLSNESITQFLQTAEKLDHISAPAVRANATGIFQAILGLWEILGRQGEIARASLDDSWKRVIGSFAPVTSGVEVFEAGEASFKQLLHDAGAKMTSQDELVGLLAGPAQNSAAAREVRQELALKIRAVLEAQRLVSVDTLFALGDGMNEAAKGNRASTEALLGMAAELHEFQMPRPIFTASERVEYTQQRSDVDHTTLQARTNFARIIKSGTPKELADARGRLSAFLRDTLVGLNYAYYEPPGAQMLHNNAIFVRSHDYSEDSTRGAQPWKAPQLINLGVTASGGAHLCGSLADLPYVLAVVEQDFIVPDAVQSLIWQDLVPTLLSGSVLPRWWNVTPHELHAVALYQRAGEELLTSAAGNDDLRAKVLAILSDRILPKRLGRIEAALRDGQPQNALNQATPADTFFLTAEFRRRFPSDNDHWGSAGKQLQDLIRDNPEETSWDRLSQDFGEPHPALEHSSGRELVNMKLFPVYLHYSSRLLAESWDSNILYWARLADELGYEPAALNQLVPELTRRMVEKLFATDLEDWPSVLRATRETGDEFLAGKLAFAPKKISSVN